MITLSQFFAVPIKKMISTRAPQYFIHVLIAFTTVLATESHCYCSQNYIESANRQAFRQALSTLQACPTWTSLSPGLNGHRQAVRRRIIIRDLRKISSYDVVVVRAAVIYYLTASGSSGTKKITNADIDRAFVKSQSGEFSSNALAKLTYLTSPPNSLVGDVLKYENVAILTRYMFNVPKYVALPSGNPQRIGLLGFAEEPRYDHERAFDGMWPLVYNRNGHLAINRDVNWLGIFSGTPMSIQYIVYSFDYSYKHFGRRTRY